MNLNELAKECHRIAKEKGFWEVEQSTPTKLMLVVTELGEACEADRHGDEDNFREEIADTFIRLLDLCGYLDINPEDEILRKIKINKERDLIDMVKNIEIREIGIEKEVFLLNQIDRRIMEPKLYGFPRDEFEFLVELRSLPSDRLYPVLTTLQQEELQYKLRANKFGMYLSDMPNTVKSKEWVEKHWDKYDLYMIGEQDATHNVYTPPSGTYKCANSHHLGILDTDDDNIKRLTAGMHIHFSSRDAKTGEVIELPIEDIVKKMDNEFEKTISSSYRNLGEYELKTHGFEYRSLPCNADVYDVLKKSFKILREV